MYARVEVAVRPEFSDPGSQKILRTIELVLPDVAKRIRWARLLQVYWLEMDVPRPKFIEGIREVFWDPVTHWLITGDLIPSAAGYRGNISDLLGAAPERTGKFWGLEKKFRPGVTDNVGRTAIEAMEIVLGEKVAGARVASGELLVLEGQELDESQLQSIAREIFCNELIESWTLRLDEEVRKLDRFQPEIIRSEFPRVQLRSRSEVETYSLSSLKDDDLLKLSRENLWALNLEEMRAIRNYYKQSSVQEERTRIGLGDPTDVEMEVLAQTWSEHCKHKIFNANVKYHSKQMKDSSEEIPETIQSLFKQTIAGTTEKLKRPWLLSVFDDNAGLVDFDEEDAVCIKVETHNSPSALDPYGGALTGIVGVNRDILGCGRGARPIFNTNVFCVADPGYGGALPERIHHPRRILEGVRRGVEEGGNKSGIPTVNGALVFDRRYLGKPLIYCGTGGLIPKKSGEFLNHEKKIQPGDRICMVGGRIGKDGIHGATFSSLAMDEFSPSSAVQLGDPITQKRMSDFIIEARDLGLFRTLTDNGAGGLSSSVGELARITGGARMDVSRARVKYPGLKPYELVVSESQERMTVAVPPEKLNEFQKLAEKRNVEVSDLGEFNQSGLFEIQIENKTVGAIRLDFLHKGNPKLELIAEWSGLPNPPKTVTLGFELEGPRRLLELLGRPNIASKEWLIRQYDHEVQGTSVLKPLQSTVGLKERPAVSPNDASVLKLKPHSFKGLTVGCGINPKLSDIDTYLMAQWAVDEAVRNVLCAGAEYGSEESMLALVDNFCWPDPVEDPHKMAQLVRACYGLKRAALELGCPLISGKDSMKNDYRGRLGGDPVTISVVPTLLVTAMARVADIRNVRSANFKSEGDGIYIVGSCQFGLWGSELQSLLQERPNPSGSKTLVLPSKTAGTSRAPQPNWDLARRTYRWISGTDGKFNSYLRSIHDVSEGGVLVAIAESLFAHGLGAEISFGGPKDIWELAFGEAFHTFIVSINKENAAVMEEELKMFQIPFRRLGTVQHQPILRVREKDDLPEWSLSLKELREAWTKEGYWQ